MAGTALVFKGTKGAFEVLDILCELNPGITVKEFIEDYSKETVREIIKEVEKVSK